MNKDSKDKKKTTKKTIKTKQTVTKKDTKPSTVAKGHFVSVEYTGTLDNGEEFDSSKNHGPIKFVVGNSQVIKGFDDAVIGMKVNDSKKVKIAKEHAYGDVNPALFHKVPIDKLPPDMKGQIKIGGFIVLQSPTGQQIPAKVTNIGKEEITLDLNHPLAGKNLTFDIKVVDISTEKEEGCACGGDCGCGSDGEKGDCGCTDETCQCK